MLEGQLNSVIHDSLAEKPHFHVTAKDGQAEGYPLVIDESLCSAYRLEVISKYAFLQSYVPGEFWELGVYKGGSASLLSYFCAQSGKLLRLFDSFEGVPEPCELDRPEGGETKYGEPIMRKGEWANPNVELVMSKLREGTNVSVRSGWIPESLSGLEESTIAFAHVDLDLYEGTKGALQFILPRLAPGGIIVVDDFDYPRNPGVKRAVEEVFPRTDAGFVPYYRLWVECDWQCVIRRSIEYVAKEV